MTHEETRMASAQLLKITHDIDDKVTKIDVGVESVDDKVKGVDDKLTGVDVKVMGVDDKVMGVDARVMGVDDKVTGVDARVIGVDDKVNAVDAKLNDVSDTVQLVLDGACCLIFPTDFFVNIYTSRRKGNKNDRATDSKRSNSDYATFGGQRRRGETFVAP